MILNASMRQQSTHKVLKKLEDHLNGCEVNFLNIKDYDIKPCLGCEKCMRKGGCSLEDDGLKLLNDIRNSDGIIIGTPVYLRQISGYLKVLIDRTCVWYHRSPLVSKPIFFVTSTQVSGSKAAIKYLKDLSLQWGTLYTGHLSRTMFTIDKSLDENILSDFQYYLQEDHKKNYKPSFKQIIEFNTQKVLALNVLPLDKAYWQENGYDHKPYYYTCRINGPKRFIGKAYYKLLSYIINKNKS